MAKGHQINWYAAGDDGNVIRTVSIRSDVDNPARRTNVLFLNNNFSLRHNPLSGPTTPYFVARRVDDSVNYIDVLASGVCARSSDTRKRATRR
jgi:hypothetical protein